eukprot:snap_masked-scaffold_42-processed-gene-2.24-mRNA-1 protein AED:1.00 eAED:1.00 QI:0/-1/0/0/-1/1/1/0/85
MLIVTDNLDPSRSSTTFFRIPLPAAQGTFVSDVIYPVPPISINCFFVEDARVNPDLPLTISTFFFDSTETISSPNTELSDVFYRR